MASTPLLGLSLPADGTTNWGTLANTSITALIDSAIAGTTTLSADADVTLTATTEAPNEARQAILLCTGARTGIRTITAPAQSKTYVVVNNTTGGYGVKVVGTGPTTGVTIASGAVGLIVWNGSDFTAITTTSVGGSNTQVQYNNSGTLAGSPNLTFNGTTLTAANFADSSLTSGRVTYAGAGGNLTDSANLTFDGSKLSVYGVTIGRGANSVSSNTAIGTSTLNSNTTAYNNTAIGYEALYSSSTGFGNTAVGYQSLYSATGQANTAVGTQALYANTSGLQNVAVGYEAAKLNTTGGSITAMGYGAAANNSSANSITAIGNLAGNRSTADNGTFVGSGAGTGNFFGSSGQNNTAIGYTALYVYSTASDNVAVGYQAGFSITTGSFNTAIGPSAGRSITTGSKNTIIGGYTGNQGGLDIRTSNNYVVLSDGDGNPRAYWNGADATFNGKLTLTATFRSAVGTVSSASTITPTSDSSNQYNVTALAVPATIAAPSGTPVDGQKLLLRIKDDGTGRALTWNGIFRAIGVTLPTTTVATKTTYVGCVYNSADAVWDVVAVTTQA